MTNYDYDVVVIGSGVGGLTSSALLAKEGLKVLVLEQSHRIGGCCSNYNHNGYQPDVGAIFVIAHELYYKLFELLDLRLEDYLDYKILDPVYDTILDGGMRVELPQGMEPMEEVINQIAPQDVAGFRRYNRDMENIMGAYRAVVKDPMPSLRNVTKLSHLAKFGMHKEIIPAIKPSMFLATRSLRKAVESYFTDENLRLMFGWENLYAALPAHRCTALYANITHMGRLGNYYPKGGMIAIPEALGKITEQFGGEIRYNACVEKILMQGNKAKGVRLEDGTEISCKAVVSDIHTVTTYGDLVGYDKLSYAVKRALKNQPYSIPAPTIYYGLKNKLDSVRSHMSVVLPPRAQFDDVWVEFYDKGLMYRADDGALLISCASHTDPGLAPEGGQVLSVIYIAPYKLKYHNWDDIGEQWAWEVAESLEKRAFPGLTKEIEWVDSCTPVELERRLRLPGGAFFGIEMSLGNMGLFRANWRSPSVEGLYMVGQCTNPGGGVPLVMTSGIAASSFLINDWNKL